MKHDSLALALTILALVVQRGTSFRATFSVFREFPSSAKKSQVVQVTKIQENDFPGSDLFPEKGPYVPSGLTAAQYEQLKRDEAAKLKKMNFGAWGPRFKPSDVPDGDWFVIPTLWTSGVDLRARPKPANAAASTNGDDSQKENASLPRIRSFFRENGYGFVMGYIVVDFLATTITMLRGTGMTVKQMLWTISKLALLTPRSKLVAFAWKYQAVKIALAVFLTPAMNEVLERANRRMLWTNARTILTSAVASFSMLVIWMVLLRARLRFI